MLDWLTLRLPPERISAALRHKLQERQSWVQRIDQHGELAWRSPVRERLRSDSHAVHVLCGYDLEIAGSPARVRAGNNVFGSRDPRECAADMLAFVERVTGAQLPAIEHWRVTRMDVTLNYLFGCRAEVRQALSFLALSEGGHYRVQSKAETVYWNQSSRKRAAKAYHKGQHLRYQIEREEAIATPAELCLADRLLRLELALRGAWWREHAVKPWYEYSAEELEAIHADYFGRFLTCEVPVMGDLLASCCAVARTKGQGEAAYRTYLLIREVGLRHVQSLMPRSTWGRHRKILFEAGLSWADLKKSNVIPLRRRSLDLGAPVHSWEDISQREAA